MTFLWDYSSIAYSCIMGCQSNFSERGAVIKKKKNPPIPIRYLIRTLTPKEIVRL